MANTTDKNTLEHRLFAKLLMFLTLLIGGLIGYAVGFQMGQQNAMMLLEQGKLNDQVIVDQYQN